MTIKHKVIREYQYLSPDKKIFILKIGTILQEYIYRIKNESIPIDKQIIDNNPDFFELIDWKSELITHMKTNKMPQPSQLSKKLIPFIEEMILSSIPQQSVPLISSHKIKALEQKELDLNSKERQISDKEDEIQIRLKRVEKREEEYKLDLKNLDKKENDLRERSRKLTEKDLDLQDKSQDLNERERNLDRSLLESSKEIDNKYITLQQKIDDDLKIVSDKERELEFKTRELKNKEEELSQKEADISDKIRNFELKIEEYKREEEKRHNKENLNPY